MKKAIYFNGIESNEIYTEIPECFGAKYIVRTCGEPVPCDNEEELAAAIENAEFTAFEEAAEEDVEYINELAKLWGIA